MSNNYEDKDSSPDWQDIVPGSTEALKHRARAHGHFSVTGEYYPIHPIFPFEATEGGFQVDTEQQGTAFFISRTGIFLTAKHVVPSNDVPYSLMLINVPNGTCVGHRIHRLSRHPQLDIAVGVIGAKNVPCLSIGADELKSGQRVIFMGFPATQQATSPDPDGGVVLSQNFKPYACDGVVREFRADHPNGPVYDVDSVVHPGMSGGPMFAQESGHTYGVISRGMRDVYEFVVPIAAILDWQIECLKGSSLRELSQRYPAAFDFHLQPLTNR